MVKAAQKDRHFCKKSAGFLRGGILCLLIVLQLFCGGGSVLPDFDTTWNLSALDLNGDGLTDLISSNTFHTSGSIYPFLSVILQDPTGPGTLLAPVMVSLPAEPLDIRVGDLNGDSAPDIAVATSDASRGVLVLF